MPIRRFLQNLVVLTAGVLFISGCVPANDEPEAFINDFVHLAPSRILLVLDNGQFLRTNDNGESWDVSGSLAAPSTEHSVSLRKVVKGKQGNLWGLYDYNVISEVGKTSIRTTQIVPFALAFSEDTRTFRELVIRTDTGGFAPSDLIEFEGRPPLIADALVSELRIHNGSDEFDSNSFDAFKDPPPIEWPRVSAVCNGMLFSWIELQDSSELWSTDINQDNWILLAVRGPTESVRWLGCASDGDLWAVSLERAILLYDSSLGEVNEVYRLKERVDRLVVDPIGEHLVMARANVRNFISFDLLSKAGFVTTLPDFPDRFTTDHGTVTIRHDSDGNLFAGYSSLQRFDEASTSWKRVWP